MAEISAAEWDALAGPQPVLRHAFLHALERSGCASAATGWQPQHLGLWRGPHLAAAMRLYRKSHSYGEYVFDWRWADAYEQAGGRYFPKLLCAVRFTPVPLVGTAFFVFDASLRFGHFVWHLLVMAGSGCHLAAAMLPAWSG